MSYTQKFHTLSIRGGVKEEDDKVASFMNGLKFNIQDEIGLNIPRTLEEFFQIAIRIEEKLKRKNERQNNIGGSSMRGRGGRSQSNNSSNQDKDKGSTSETRGGHRGGIFGSGRGGFT